MGEHITLAILLRKTLLANDDVVFEFFTLKWGRVTVFAKKFARSKKRIEVDFFRLLEIKVFQGRNSKLLKGAETRTLFSGFEESLKANQIGWNWILQLLKTAPEEYSDEALFKEVCSWFTGFNTSNAKWADLGFRLRMIHYAGDCPRFDVLRKACFFSPVSKTFSYAKASGTIFLSNDVRQVCEFLRRSMPDIVYEKANILPQQSFSKVQFIVGSLEENI